MGLSLRPALVLIATLLVWGCGEERPKEAVPKLESLLAAANESFEAAPGGAEGRKKLHVYIDASESMRGFVTSPNSRYRRALDQLLDRTIAGGYEVSLYRFDTQVATLPASYSAGSLNSPDFFTGSETSFPRLFERLKAQRKPGEIAVILTDLVQSGRTGEQRELSRAFQEAAAQRPEVSLLGLRSAFIGSYWPESTPDRDRLDVDFRTEDPGKSRPFYLLFIADSQSDLEVLSRRLELDPEIEARHKWQLDASRPAALVSQTDFINAKNFDPGEWRRLREPRELEPKGRTYRKAFWLFAEKLPKDSGRPARFELRSDKHTTDLANIERVELEVRRCSFERGRPVGKLEVVRLNARFSRDAEKISMEIDFPAPKPNSWEGYQIRLLPGAANLHRPIELELWSTDTDSNPKEAHRTYKLDLFVDTMVRALREPVPFSEFYVFLGRGE
jgi:hypothetical protein